MERHTASGMVVIDVQATCQDRRMFTHFSFVAMFGCSSLEQYLDAIASITLDQQVATASRFYYHPSSYYMWVYWMMYMQGYRDYLIHRVIDITNPYYRFLVDQFLPDAGDAGLASLSHDDVLTIIARRFSDFDALREHGNPRKSGLPALAPLRIIACDPLTPKARPIVIEGVPQPLYARHLDGHHRLFMAALSGVEKLSGIIDIEPRVHDDLFGAVEQLEVRDDWLVVEGWLVHPTQTAGVVEVRVAGGTVATAPLYERADIADAFPDIPHARFSGFRIDRRCEIPVDELHTLTFFALHDWLPIGSFAVGAPMNSGKSPLTAAEEERQQHVMQPAERSYRTDISGRTRGRWRWPGRRNPTDRKVQAR
jgi:hypothetical protein